MHAFCHTIHFLHPWEVINNSLVRFLIYVHDFFFFMMEVFPRTFPMYASRYYDIYSSQRDSMIYRYGLLHNFTLEILA